MDIKYPSITIINGNPGSGKSHLTKYLLYSAFCKQSVDYPVIFTNTHGDYEYIDPKYVNYYSEDRLRQVLATHVSDYKAKHLLLVFDDVLDSVNWNSRLLLGLITRYRHFFDSRISLIISTQYINKIPPFIRECGSYVVLFKLFTAPSIKASYQSYAARFFDNEALWKKYVESNTGNYYFVFIDNKSQSPNMSDQFKVCKCPEKLPKFQIS